MAYDKALPTVLLILHNSLFYQLFCLWVIIISAYCISSFVFGHSKDYIYLNLNALVRD